MSMQDPISDMLTRIRNAQMVSKKDVLMPASKLKLAVAKVMYAEGYIDGVTEVTVEGKPTLCITLRYFEGKPVIDSMKRVSRPGLRVYKGKGDLPRVRNGLGTAIVSTPQGVMTDKQARKLGVGGEVMCMIS